MLTGWLVKQPSKRSSCVHETTRRGVLGMMAGLAVSGSPRARAEVAEAAFSDITSVPSLGAIAADRGLVFGTAFDADTLANPRQAALYRHHARILTTDNALKFGSLRPQEGPANFAPADALIAFAASAGIPVRGHNLIWNDWQPDWVSKLSSARCAYWLDRHIDEVVGRYAGRLHSWDVVNEPFWPGHGKPGGFRDGPWLAAMGPDYIARAFKRAHAADPKVKLVLNEAGPEWETVWGPSKPYRDGLLRIIDGLQTNGIRLDAVGLQGHWFPEFTFDAAMFRAYLRELGRRGLDIYLTEVDVNDLNFAGDINARDTLVAQRYRQFLIPALAEPAVKAIITWQLSDNASWIMGTPKMWLDPARAPRPLPFDADQRPKATYHTLAKLLAG
jgi:endo-1,4-beta-xylanase